MEEEKKKLDAVWITLIVFIVLTILTFIIAPLIISSILFLAIYLPLILYILIYKWIKRWFAAGVFSFSIWLNIIIILIPLAGGLIALDLMQFSEEFAEYPKYITLEEDGLIFGIRIDSLELTESSFDENIEILSTQELEQIKNEINTKVKDKIIFVVNTEVFRNVETVYIEQLQITLTKNETIEILKSQNPSTILEEKITQGLEIPEEYRSQTSDIINLPNDEIKAGALFMLTQQTITQQGPEYLIEELKEGNIKIYPKRTSLNLLIKFIPTNLVTEFIPGAGAHTFSQQEELKNFSN